MKDYADCAVVYCSSDDELTNQMLLHSLKTLYPNNPNRIDSFVITLSTNCHIDELKHCASHVIIFDEYPDVVKMLNKIHIDPDKHPLHAANDSPYSFTKLFFPFFPCLDKYSKLLYLDCDTEIFHDVTPIFDIDISHGFYFGFDETFSFHKGKLLQNIHDNKVIPLKTDFNFRYINTGGVLINYSDANKNFQRSNLSKLIDLFNLCQFNVVEQDLVNISFKTDVIDKKYISFYGHSPDSIIIHYVGKDARKVLMSRLNMIV